VSMTLAEAAAAWFPELWALASDTTFCDAPGAREAWIARKRLDPEEPIGRLLAAPDLPPDVIACLDRQRHDPGLMPRGIERARWAAMCRADDDLHQRWDRAVRRAEAAREALIARLCAHMAEGRAIARGVVAGRPLDGEVAIPAAAWRGTVLPVFGYEAEVVEGFPDVAAGTVVLAGGVHVHGVRVTETPAPAELAAPMVAPPPAPSPPARAGLAEARAWMRENVLAARERWKRDAAIAACVAAAGCRRDDARAAWGELPETVPGRAGRPRPANPDNSAK
jgi:hypothetical protein